VTIGYAQHGGQQAGRERSVRGWAATPPRAFARRILHKAAAATDKLRAYARAPIVTGLLMFGVIL
jgi:hypothetical protein